MGVDIVQVYIILILSVVAHEVAHYVTAKIIGLKELQIHIGSEFTKIHLGKIHISPIVFGGYVEFLQEDLLKKQKTEIIAFFLSGIAINIIIVVLSGIFYNNSRLISYVFWVNIASLSISLVPFFPPQNDVTKLIKYLRYKKRLSEK